MTGALSNTKRTSHEMLLVEMCAFRGMWALISRDVGHAFHAIVGSHFTIVGRLADTLIDSGWS
ncbi:hypothetical protein, partial [Oceaniovalibus sp. ACAM 378]|uniref:hypothetical protein n=1 Tax=Oceaniovalibus sp. ACAM 378 TaxID=2599923 RepID=UPI001CA35000